VRFNVKTLEGTAKWQILQKKQRSSTHTHTHTHMAQK